MDNFVVSTTCLWNFGDELIRMGVKELIPGNYLLWNRSPDFEAKQNFKSNSFSFNDLQGIRNHVSGIILAGTPQWTGRTVAFLYRMALSGTPLIALGVGSSGKSKIKKSEALILKKSFMTARDIGAQQSIEKKTGKKVPLLPCPSLFCSPLTDKVRDLAIVLQGTRTKNHRISPELFKKAAAYAKESKADVLVIYKTDWIDCARAGLNPIMMEGPKEALEMLSRYKRVVSTRLHCALASLATGGTPYLLCDDNNLRLLGGIEPFKGLVKRFDGTFEDISQSRILELKAETLEGYRPVINDFLNLVHASSC